MITYVEVTTLYAGFLYELLAERPDKANISHSVMPNWEQHCNFIRKHPYKVWLIPHIDDKPIGSTYVTDGTKEGFIGNEIGIFIKHEYQGNGYAKMIVKHMIDNHGVLFANISPKNAISQKLFLDMGFEPIQHTYRLKRS